MADPLTKLAYQTLQNGKGLLGLVHKEASTRLMNLLAPDGAPSTVPVPPRMLQDLRSSMDRLHQLDWEEAERGLYPASLNGALEALDADKDYLLAGGVFTEDFINNWIALKYEEVQQLRQRPHPHEFVMYYDA